MMSDSIETFQELKREALQNDQQLDLIFNSLPQSLALVTPGFEVLRVNQNFLSLYGVKNEDVVGRKCHEACFGSTSVCNGCLVEKAIASKQTEKRIKSFPNGEICEMTAQPVLNAAGEVTHILDMRTEITELVEKDKELRRIQFAMNQSTDEFWLFDKNWSILYASKSASVNLGYDLLELKSLSLEKFNLLNRIENTSVLYNRLKERKNMRIETVQYRKDGSAYPCEMNLSYFADDEEYIYAVVRDITKRKKYENELIESRESAERASKLKSTFLANMSHEIRTPMNAIIGFSNFVLEEDLDDETKAELKFEIKNNSNYLLSIIGDIIEISKLDSGNYQVDKKEFNVNTILERLYEEYISKCPENVTFNFNCALPNGFGTFYNDNKITKQILVQFLNNAFKFTKSGKVEMGCKLLNDNKTVRFYVADTGVGIELEKHSEIFEPFHQLNPMVQGTGIGLTICNGLADLLGTEIKLDSEKGTGSTFWFDLKNER